MDSAETSPASNIDPGEAIKSYACTPCAVRKVRCDKRQPCSACSKSRLQCRYRATPPVQRQKRKIDSSQHSRHDRPRNTETSVDGTPRSPFNSNQKSVNGLAHGDGSASPTKPRHSDAVDHIGSHSKSHVLTDRGDASQPVIRRRRRRRGVLVAEQGGRRFYEHGLVGVLGQGYGQDPTSFITESPAEDGPPTTAQTVQTAQTDPTESQPSVDALPATFITGIPAPKTASNYKHPSEGLAARYWSTYLANVHPLTKILHEPSMSPVMAQDPSDAPLKTQALRFSIYACAVSSLAEKECRETFDENRSSLLLTFQSATKHLLMDAHFLKVPDLDLLRAHVLLLTSMLDTAEASSMWMLMGTIMRLAQSQGLHRDAAVFGLSPFEVEMRRRLWWYIVTLDIRLAELTGSGNSGPKSVDTLLPSNVNDRDLRQDLESPPRERIGASEMTFCLMNYEISRHLLFHEPTMGDPVTHVSKVEDTNSILELEAVLEQKFLRFCDPVVPVQFLTTTIARSSLCKLKQALLLRRSWPLPPENRASEQAGECSPLNLAVRNIGYDNLIHSSRSLSGFFWNVNFNFPWSAPIFIMRKLVSQPSWDDSMVAAWNQIDELYEHHHELMHTMKVVHVVLGDLALQAWSARETAMKAKGVDNLRSPAFITALQARHAASSSQRAKSQPRSLSNGGQEINFANLSGFDALTTAASLETSMDTPQEPAFVTLDWSTLDGY